MVKTPKMRHARTPREPVTIDLGPDEVRRIKDETAAESAASEAATGTDARETPFEDTAGKTPDAASEAAGGESTVGEQAESEASAASFAAATPEEPLSNATSQSAEDNSEPGRFGRTASTETPGSAPASQPARPSRTSALAAGLIGGIVALAGGGALQFAGMLPSPGGTSGATADVSVLQAEVAALKQQVSGLGNGAAAAGVEELRKAVGDSAATIATISAKVETLSADLAALKSSVEAGGSGDGAAAAALGSRLDTLEAALGTLDAKVAALPQEGAGAAAEEIARLAGRIDGIEKAVNAAGAQTVDAEGRIAALEKSLADIGAKVEAQADQPRIALAIAASALKAAVDRGGPFASEVETFAAVAPESPELADLRALAKEGVPSRADLLAAAPDAAIAMIAAADTVDDNAGFFERLLASAESLVKVRPIGVVEGDGVDAIAARIEAALKAGDLGKALAEYETLPEGPKAAGAEFAEKIRLRQRAEDLVDRALAGALKA